MSKKSSCVHGFTSIRTKCRQRTATFDPPSLRATPNRRRSARGRPSIGFDDVRHRRPQRRARMRSSRVRAALTAALVVVLPLAAGGAASSGATAATSSGATVAPPNDRAALAKDPTKLAALKAAADARATQGAPASTTSAGPTLTESFEGVHDLRW